MIFSSYILFRVLVCDLLLNPSGLGLIPLDLKNEENHTKDNFKILASMTYYTIMEYAE